MVKQARALTERSQITVTTKQKIIKNKLGLLRLAETLGNISQTCRVMDYSRDSFSGYEVSRKKPRPANRVAAAVEGAVGAIAYEQPDHGQLHVSKERKKRGLSISPQGTPQSAGDQSRTREPYLIFTEAQLHALVKAQQDKEAHGRSKRHPRVIWQRRTPSTSARSKDCDAFTSEHSSTPTPAWPRPAA
jgi:hypothetical protein